MKKIILSSTVALMMATSANAFMGINAEIGGGVWLPALSGSAQIGSNGEINFENSNMDDKSASGNNYLYADFSHFVPIVPNVRAEKLTYNIENSAKDTKVDMKQTDLIAYWGVPFVGLATAGVLNVNFGIDAKNLKGTITTNTSTTPKDFDETLPLLYLNARVDIPFAPVDFEATTKNISYDGASISDNEAKLSVKLPIPMPLVDFKVDLGYRVQNITIPNSLVDGLKAKVDTKGTFFGLSAKF